MSHPQSFCIKRTGRLVWAQGVAKSWQPSQLMMLHGIIGGAVYAKTAAGESSGDRPSDRYTFGRLKSLIYNKTQYTHMGLW